MSARGSIRTRAALDCRRFGCVMLLATVWSTVDLPAARASVALDTQGVPAADIASALRRAYQLPALLALAHTPEEEDAAVARERERLRKLMVEQGYLDAEVLLRDSAKGAVLRAVLGRRYTVSSVELKGVRQSELGTQTVIDLSAIVRQFVGQPASASAAETFGRRILDSVDETDFALARLHSVEWSPTGDGTVAAAVTLDTGPKLRFGNVSFSGLRRLKVAGLQRLVPFRHGDRYERSQMEHLRGELKAMDAIKYHNVDLSVDANGLLAVEIRVREAPPDLSILEQVAPFGFASGLAALATLALAQIAAQAGAARAIVRPLAWAGGALVITFAIAATPRLLAFVS